MVGVVGFFAFPKALVDSYLASLVNPDRGSDQVRNRAHAKAFPPWWQTWPLDRLTKSDAPGAEIGVQSGLRSSKKQAPETPTEGEVVNFSETGVCFLERCHLLPGATLSDMDYVGVAQN